MHTVVNQSMSDVLIIIPTYNEIENIGRMVDTVMALPDGFDLLVIDDGSPDGTADEVRRKMTQYPGRVNLECRKGKLGLGTAYIHGFKWALNRDYNFVIEMDADFSHNPADLTHLYHTCKDNGADVCVGSRYLTDSTAGFVCYRRKVLETINLDKIEFKGYAFQIEMKFKAHKLGFRIVEHPIIFVNRQLGTSKMNSGIFGEAVFGVCKLRLRALTGTLNR